MSVSVRIDSLYKFASSYYDEAQSQYVWGIADPPDCPIRDDDQYYTFRSGDRIDLIAHKMLGSTRWFWVVMHYNNIKDALDTEDLVDKELRLPSRLTLEREFSSAFNTTIDS